jgi:enamine deaminase RidA (YjgF/YER057c/UK114 family)
MGYSHAVRVPGGSVVLVSGQVGLDDHGDLVAGGVRGQAEQVFTNLGRALDSAGATFADVVKLNYYCADAVTPEDIDVVRQVRDRYVNVNAPPASTFVVVRRLVRPELLIEIEAMAVVTRPAG